MKNNRSFICLHYTLVLSSLFMSSNGKLFGVGPIRQKGSAEYEKWYEMQSQTSPYLFEVADVKTLKSVQVVFRHGARNPTGSYPTDPYANYDYGVKGPGQLLRVGKKQGLELGSYLRKRYAGFISSEYSLGEVYAQTSDVDRTIMTTEMVLAGLFPVEPPVWFKKNVDILDSLNWQPIPLRTIPKSVDNKLRGITCPWLEKLYNDYLAGSEFKKIQKRNKPVYEYFEKNTGINGNDFQKVADVTHTLNVQALNGLTLPNWTQPIFPTKLNRVLDLFLTTNTSTPELSRMRLGPIMAQFVQNMEMTIVGAPAATWAKEDLNFYHFQQAKVYLFGGHDKTIATILNALHLYDGDVPAYTSALILELHTSGINKNSSSETDFTVKVLYKKVRHAPIMEFQLPKCPVPCTLSDFKTNYKQLIAGDGQWAKECQFNSVEKFDNEKFEIKILKLNEKFDNFVKNYFLFSAFI